MPETKFQKANRVPSADTEVIDFRREQTVTTLIIPPPQLFGDEIAFWRACFGEAKRAGQDPLRKFIKELLGGLASVAAERNDLESTPGGGLVKGVLAGYWYKKGATLMANSRLLREAFEWTGPEAGRTASLLADLNICVDLGEDIQDVDRYGLHVTPAVAQDLGIEPLRPSQSVWYEGQDIYVEAFGRAWPTPFMEDRFHEAYGEQFPAQRFISAVPHIKHDAWNIPD